MAVVKLNPILVRLQGTLGSLVFYHTPNTIHIRPRPRHVNPRSPKQMSYRNAYTTAHRLYASIWRHGQSDWRKYAPSKPRTLTGSYSKQNMQNLRKGKVTMPISRQNPNDRYLKRIRAIPTPGSLHYTLSWDYYGTDPHDGVVIGTRLYTEDSYTWLVTTPLPPLPSTYDTPDLAPGKREFHLIGHNTRTDLVTFAESILCGS